MMRINSHFSVIDNAKIYYKTWQSQTDADWIILLHDALGSVEQWKNFPELLQRGTNLNVLAYDRVGHGLSSPNNSERTFDYLNTEAVFLNSFLNTLKIKNPYLLGYSDGGSISLIYASKTNANCNSVCSLAAHVFVESITIAGIQKTQKTSIKLKTLLEKYHQDKTDKLFSDWANTWLNPSFSSWNIFSLLPQIKVPILAIQGEKDEYGTKEQLETISKCSLSKCIEIKAAKHALIQENAQEIIKEFKKFNAL